MSAVWYTGRANSRTISVAEWASVGVTVAQPTVWDKSNGYSLPQSGFSPTQLTILDNNENFQTNAADGPRTGAVPEAIPRSQALAKLSDLDDLQAVVNSTFAPVYPLPNGLTGSGRYDGLHGLYRAEASQLRKTRAKLAQAAAGTGLCRILCAGDSITEGVGATGKPDVSSYPKYLRDLLVNRGYPSAGTGWVPPRNNNTGNTDSRWSIAGAGFADFGSANKWASMWMSTTTSGANATFTSDVAGTVVDIAYLNNLSFSGAFTYSIDGATSGLGFGTVTPLTTENSLAKVTITGLSNTAHTVKITTTSTMQTFLGPVQVRNATSGVLLSNLGVGSSMTAAWVSNPPYPFFAGTTSRGIDTYDLVIVEPMIVNDAVNAVGAATSQANLTNIVTAYKATGADVILVCPPTPDPNGTGLLTTATWTPYKQAVYAVADAMNVPVVEPGDRWGTWATAQANGLMNDQYHPSSAGYRDIAPAVLRLIAPAG